MFQQDRQNPKRLILKLDLQAVLAQFTRSQVRFKGAKADNPERRDWVFHGSPKEMAWVYHTGKARQSRIPDRVMA